MEMFKDYLVKHGLKCTVERNCIFKAARSLDNTFSIEELLERVLKRGLHVSKSTVYRNIPLLIRAGVIRTEALGLSHSKMFVKCDSCAREKTVPCKNCGASVVVKDGIMNELSTLLSTLPEDKEDDLEELVNTLLVLKGRCLNCMPAENMKLHAGGKPVPARILLFEDESALRVLLKDLLENDGHEVYEYPDCNCFYDECMCSDTENGSCADIIIIDIKMPGISGIEFIKKLLGKKCRIKNIAFMSAYQTDDDLAYIGSIGGKFFCKPDDMPKIKDWVENCRRSINGERLLANNFLGE
ncbi:MAG: transcriptional repressor [Victivallales bacterium]